MRELDPELFGFRNEEAPVSSGGAIKAGPLNEARQGFIGMELKELRETVRQQKLKISELEAKTEHLAQVLKDTQEVTANRDDRNHQASLRLEKNLGQLKLETTDFAREVSTRLKERRGAEHRVEEMLERHNSIIQTYETRLIAFQKLLSEKEAQTNHFMAIIRELRQEMQKLRGM